MTNRARCTEILNRRLTIADQIKCGQIVMLGEEEPS